MKRIIIILALTLIGVSAFSLKASAEETKEKESAFFYEVGADVVSAYLWRGQNLGGLSIQPSVTLGWNGLYDWYDCDTIGDDIINTDGSIKENDWGLLEIARWVSIYVSEDDVADLKDRADGGNSEGYNCTVCKIEKDGDDNWIVVPV